MNLALKILVESYFDERDHRRFGIDLLAKRGFEVQIWEVFHATNPEYARSYEPSNPCQYVEITRFRSLAEINQAFDLLTPTDILLLAISCNAATLPILRSVCRRHLFFGQLFLGFPGIAPSHMSQSLIKRLARLLDWNPKGWLDALFHRLPLSSLGLIPWPYLILGGGESLLSTVGRFRGPDTALIWTHTLDYDLFLASGGMPDTAEKHIVFLDEYVPFHPDYLCNKIPVPTTAEAYYPKMTRLFGQLEQRLSLPVVVAAHPRSQYQNHPDYFDGREVVCGRTCELVRAAALVISHCSTANNFSVLYRKPVLFVTTDDLRGSYYGPFIEAFADLLGRDLINLDTGYELEPGRLDQVDEAKYRDYQSQFIKRPGTPEKLSWDTFADFMQALFALQRPLSANTS